jgi:hypothetical protein
MLLINQLPNPNLDVAVPGASRTVLLLAPAAGVWGDRTSELLRCGCQGGRYSGASRRVDTTETHPQAATEV